VEAAFLVEQAVGGEEVQVGMEDEVVAKGVGGGGSGDASFWEAESGAAVVLFVAS